MNKKILVLNKYYFPVGVCDEKKTFGNIFSGVVQPLDITYEIDENGNKTDQISYFTAIKGSDEWLKLPVREYDDYIKTTKGKVRMPSVVVCSSFDGIPHKKVMFPTRHSIYKRDNYTCGYTGIPLIKENMTVDHIHPRSKTSEGGNPNTWENQITCHRELNIWKGDTLLHECDLKTFKPTDPELQKWLVGQGKKLKLLKKPTKPKEGFKFADFLDDWEIFLRGE